MPAIRKNSNRTLKDLSRGVQFIQFFRAEYAKRKLRQNLIAGTWYTKEDIQQAHKKVREAIVRYYDIEHTANSHRVVMMSAVAYLHNSLVRAPQHVYNDFENPFTLDEMEPLLQNCDTELWLMREISHQYGFFYYDILQPVIPGETILKNILAKKTPIPPIPFPMKNDGQDNICEFRFIGDIDRQQYFDEENDQHIYIYIDALGSKLKELQPKIEEILKQFSDKNPDTPTSFGDKASATMQIFFKKTTPPKHYKDIVTLSEHAIEQYRTQYNNPNGYLDLRVSQQQKLMWLIYGKDNLSLDFEIPAIGLWLWDLIHIEKRKTSEARKLVMDAPFKHLRRYYPGKDNMNNYTRQQSLHRQLKDDLKETKKIIVNIVL